MYLLERENTFTTCTHTQMFVFMYVVVTLWGSVGMFVVYQPLLKIVFSLEVLKYVACLCSGCDGCCVFCLYCEAWSCRCSCMGSVSVSSYRCLCLSCGSSQCCIMHDLQYVIAGRRCKMILQSWSHNCLVGSHECLLLFTPSCGSDL